jgi:hypothetical protein
MYHHLSYQITGFQITGDKKEIKSRYFKARIPIQAPTFFKIILVFTKFIQAFRYLKISMDENQNNIQEIIDGEVHLRKFLCALRFCINFQRRVVMRFDGREAAMGCRFRRSSLNKLIKFQVQQQLV